MSGSVNDLGVSLNNMLTASKVKNSVLYTFMGLVLGPVLYDLWLLKRVTLLLETH